MCISGVECRIHAQYLTNSLAIDLADKSNFRFAEGEERNMMQGMRNESGNSSP